MKKIADSLVIGCFLLFIFAAMAVTVLRPKQADSHYENRYLATFPEITLSRLADGEFFAELETYLADHAALRNTALKLKTAADLYVFHRPVVNQVVVTDTAILAHRDYAKFDPDEVAGRSRRFAETLLKLQEQVEDYGGAYLYVGVPDQSYVYADIYPRYMESGLAYGDTVRECFAAASGELGLNYLNAAPYLFQKGDRAELSSTIDHHFNLIAAYYSYELIVQRLGELYGLELDFPREISFHELEAPYLGSRSRKLMGLYTSSERLIYAEFPEDIPFTRQDYVYPMPSEVYSFATTIYGDLTYNLYMGGDQSETVIKTNRPELPSLLIYGDSFTNALECLMYYSFDELRSIDLRHYTDMSLSEYIELHRPDIVICIRGHDSLIEMNGNGDPF